MREAIFFVVLLLLCNFVFAVSGVVPGSYSVDFEPNLEREFVFDFVLDGYSGLSVDGGW